MPPARPQAPLGPKTLAFGARHLCLIEAGNVFCRGGGEAGQLGEVVTDDAATDDPAEASPGPDGGPDQDAFVQVPGVGDALRIAASGDATCVLQEDGRVVCWGTFEGVGATPFAPLVVEGVAGAIDIGVGRAHGCAVQADGAVSCWDGRGRGETVPGIDDAAAITAGWFHTCARRRDGRVACFGGSDWGALGADAPDDVVVAVEGVRDTVAIDADAVHACAVRGDQTVTCWGRPRPTIAGVQDAAAVAVGQSHACILHRGGHVSCVGEGTHGELGDGHRESSREPVLVEGLEDVTELVASGESTCARGSDGFLCWGALWPYSIDSPGYRPRPAPLRREGRTDAPRAPTGTAPPAIVLAGASVVEAAELIAAVFEVEVVLTPGASDSRPLTGELPGASPARALGALATLAGLRYRRGTGGPRGPSTPHRLVEPPASSASADGPTTDGPATALVVDCPGAQDGTWALPCVPADRLRVIAIAGGSRPRAVVTSPGRRPTVVEPGNAVGEAELHWGPRETGPASGRQRPRPMSSALRVGAIGPRGVYLERAPGSPARRMLELGEDGGLRDATF